MIPGTKAFDNVAVLKFCHVDAQPFKEQSGLYLVCQRNIGDYNIFMYNLKLVKFHRIRRVQLYKIKNKNCREKDYQMNPLQQPCS